MEVPFRVELEGIDGGPVIVRALQRILDTYRSTPFQISNSHIHVGTPPPEGNEAGDIGDLYLRVDQGASLNAGYVNPPGFLAAGGTDLASQATPILWAKYLNNGSPRGWSPVGAFTRIATAQPGDIGTVNNWIPGAGVGVPTTALLGNTIINWGPGISSDATITGIPRGYNGQLLYIRNNSASNIISFAHNSTSSVYGNRFANIATSGNTPVGASGYVLYEYDGTIWSMLAHDQGTWITPTFAAGNYTASGAQTWTVEAGDVTTQAYLLRMKTLSVRYVLITTTVGGTASNQLFIGNGAWGSFTCTKQVEFAGAYVSDNGTTSNGWTQIAAGGVNIGLQTSPANANWTASTNNTRVAGAVDFEVT